jgi:hypothetical protein
VGKRVRTTAPSRAVRLLLRTKGRFVKAVTKPLRWIAALLTPQPRTPGEAAFEADLRESSIRFRYEVQEVGKARRPDYTIRFGTRAVKIDVKDLEQESDVSTTIDQGKLAAIAVGAAEDDGGAIEVHAAGGGYDPHGRLREKVNVARAQFREYKGMPCAVVLYTEGHGAELRSAEIMLGVMYGNYGISIPFNTERGDFVGTEPEYGFQSGGSVLHRRTSRDEVRVQNTTISAIITLREVKIGTARLAEYLDTHAAAADIFDPGLHERLKADEVHYGVIVGRTPSQRLRCRIGLSAGRMTSTGPRSQMAAAIRGPTSERGSSGRSNANQMAYHLLKHSFGRTAEEPEAWRSTASSSATGTSDSTAS